MRVLLRDLAPGQDYAIKFRSNNGEEVSEWSQVQRFTTTNDTIPPSTPLNLSWYNSGPAFIAEWDAVTTQATNPASPLKDFRHYRCSVTDGVKTVDFFTLVPRFELSKEMNIAAFGEMKSALTINVRAVDLTYNESGAATAIVNPANPPVPAASVLSNYFGSILLEYNGLDSGGATMPTNIDYLEIHLGTTNNFTATASTMVDRLEMNRSAGTQRALLTGLTNGTTYYARLVAVSLTGRKSSASAISNGVTKDNLTGLDIKNGQIGTAQINFTARDIGGANAYYSTSQPTGGTYKEGDIWYDTDNGYTTYRYNGTTWVAAPEVGVVSGTKIIAGTVTADAVGTNLLITAKANIGEAIIDSGHIDELSANVITTGVLESSFDVTYGGVTQPAWSFDVNGNAVLNNVTVNGQVTVGNSNNPTASSSFAIRSYNYVAGTSGWSINGDGKVEFADAVIRGEYRTADTGRRIEIGSAGRQGYLMFYGPNNEEQWLRSIEGDPGYQEIQMRGSSQGLINIGSNNILSTWGIHNYAHYNQEYSFWLGNANLTENMRKVFGFHADGDMVHYDPHNNAVFQEFDGTGQVRFVMPSGAVHLWKTDGQVEYQYGTGKGSVTFTSQGNTNVSPGIIMYSGSGHGAKIQLYQDGRGQFLECRWWNDGGWNGIRASAFEVNSSVENKSNIQVVPTGELLTKVMSTQVKKYERKQPPNSTAKARIEYGLIAQEAPPEIVSVASKPEDTSIELYQMISMVWGALQEVQKQLVTLRGQVKLK